MSDKGQSQSGFLMAFMGMVTVLGLFLAVLFTYPHDYQRSPGAKMQDVVGAGSDTPSNPQAAGPVQATRASPLARTRSWKPASSPPPSGTAEPQVMKSGHEALPSLSQANIQSMLNDAMGLVDEGNPQAAVELLESIIKADPKNEMALIEMGMIHLIDFKSPQGAVGYLKSALEANPENRVVISELVGVFDELGQAQEGTRYLRQLYDANPDNRTLAMGIGQMLAGQNRLNEALPYLEKSAEDGSSMMAVTDLADVYSRAGQGDKALETYQRAIRLEQEKFANGYYSRDENAGRKNILAAHADHLSELLHQNKMAEAKEALRKIETEYPDDMNEIARRMGRDYNFPLR